MGIQLDYSNKSLELMFSNFLQILTITWHFRKHQNLENSCLIPFFFLILKQPKVLSVCWLFPVIRLSHFQKVIISGKLWQYLGMPKLCPTPGQVPKCYIQILYYLIIPFLMSSSLLRFRKKKENSGSVQLILLIFEILRKHFSLKNSCQVFHLLNIDNTLSNIDKVKAL